MRKTVGRKCGHVFTLLVCLFFLFIYIYIYIYLSRLQKLHNVFFITPMSVSTTSVARLLVDDDDDDDGDGCQKYVQ